MSSFRVLTRTPVSRMGPGFKLTGESPFVPRLRARAFTEDRDGHAGAGPGSDGSVAAGKEVTVTS
jgi:hypothetical protein